MLSELRASVGAALVTDPDILDPLRRDESGHESDSLPLGVVFAETVEQVQATMRWAHAHGVPVVTRGAGTGLAGGATARSGEIVLSTLRMNAIVEVNTADQLAVVQPGIINGDFNDALAEYGFWFAPDPASRAISTVGGNIATNAGGLLCAKYGVTRDAVLALDVVLADGELLHLGHRTVKGVTGLDLTALFVGSEGQLGVIVGATVRIRPIPAGTVQTLSATFPSVRDAATASAAITATGIAPAIMELMDAATLSAAHRYLGLPETSAGQAYLVVQTDGAGAVDEADRIAAVLTELGADPKRSATAEEADELLRIRRAVHPGLALIGIPLIEDLAVPRSRLGDMFDEIARVEREFGIAIPTVAHAGDGNLHPNLLLDTPDVPEHIWNAAHALFQACLALGGTLTGEHGIGLLKQRWLAEELGDVQFDLQRRVIAAFDPTGILNPGKVYGA